MTPPTANSIIKRTPYCIMENKCSHITKGGQSSNLWAGDEYNGNNAWNFNATNGNLNNNNKMNTNGVRGSLEFDFEILMTEQFILYYAQLLDDYRDTRRHKRSKNTQLIFEYHLQEELIPLTYHLFMRDYVPSWSNCFVITDPTIREVIAAWFGDRIPQTRLVRHTMPLLEKHFFMEDSYSCRVGKGGLRAVQNLMLYIRQETKLYTLVAYIYKIDYRGFFMSIDLSIFFPVFVDLLYKYIDDDEERDEMLYLARIIYLSTPQEHCVMKSHPELRRRVDKNKTLVGKLGFVGLPIGNITSQMMSLVVTTFMLMMLKEYGLKNVHYTDDNCGITLDVESFMKFLTWLRNESVKRWHLEIHPNKFYLQYYKKTVNLLGVKIKYGTLMLPGDRMVHNFKWKITIAISKAEAYPNYIYFTKEHFAGVLCSYLGLLKHTASYNLRKEQVARLQHSKWDAVLDFDTENYLKVSVKPTYTALAYAVRQNKKRKQQLKAYYYELTGNPETN